MIEDSQVINVPYGKIHTLTLGKSAWSETFPGNSYPSDFVSWNAATNIIVSKYTKLSTDRIISLNQVHNRDIGLVEKGGIHKWIPDPPSYNSKEDGTLSKIDGSGDGLITFEPNTALVIRTADCVPIYCYSTVKPMVALLHAGWRGALNGISEKCLHWLLAEGFKEEELQVFVGPCISKKNYIVQWDVAQHFMAMPPGVVVEAPSMGYLLGVKEAILVKLRKEFSKLPLNPQSNDVFLSNKYFSHRSKDQGRNINVIFWES
jgi:YfiH family protein